MEKYTRILMVLACIVIGFVSGLTLGRYQLEKTKKEYAEAALQAEQTARAKEQAWQAAHNELQAKYEEEKKMLNPKSLLCASAYVLALCACQSPQPPVQCPKIPELGLQKREPNLTERLLMILSPLPQTEIEPSGI